MRDDYAIGIDLGGTHIKLVAVRPEGGVLLQRSCRTDDLPDPGLPWAESIRREIQWVQEEQGAPASWIGMAAPGLAARDFRTVAALPHRLHGIEGLDWTTYLDAASPVPVLNDAHAALVGEVWMGSAAGLRDVILLTLGTGVGGAILSEGKLLRGHIGRAGHLGHLSLDPAGKPDITGIPGSLEDAIGECTLVERSQGRFGSTRDLLEAVSRADTGAREIWDKSVKALAAAIASFINIVDPEAVVLGGGIAAAGPALFEPLEVWLDGMEWRPCGTRVRLLAAALGEYAGALGAAHFAVKFQNEPHD